MLLNFYKVEESSFVIILDILDISFLFGELDYMIEFFFQDILFLELEILFQEMVNKGFSQLEMEFR